jgi:type II secretory pathway pseudopilin PulG
MLPGFALLEALGLIAVLAILIPYAADLWQWGTVELQKRAVAQHFTTIVQATRKYLLQNHSQLLTDSSANTGPIISLDTLRAADCLSDMVGNSNAWRQSYHITTRLTPEGDLAGIVLTTEGRGHSNDDPLFGNVIVPDAAAMAKAGFVPTGLVAPDNVLRGPFGSWEIDLSTLGLSGLTTAGHLGVLTTLDSSDLKQDYLYRFAVPDHPELNAMRTELDMTDHAIRGVEGVQYVSHLFETREDFCSSAEDEGRTFLDSEKGLYLCRDSKIRVVSDSGNSLLMQGATLAVNGQLIEKPICPAGSATHPEIFVAPSIGAATTTGEKVQPMHSLQAWAINYSDTQWQVLMRILTSENTWIAPTDNYGRMMVFTSCAQD